MKKITKLVMVLSLSLLFLLGSKMDFYAASASLTGPTTVRAGDTITLKLNISDSGKYGLEGTLNYDSSVVSYVEMSCDVSGWKVENNGNSIIIYDDALSNPLGSATDVLTLKFKVGGSVAAGTKITISVDGIITTDGSAEGNLGAATYSTTVAAPLSSNANLSSLSVKEGKLNPGFSAGTTSYSIGDVDYSVKKLNISYKTEDGAAKVSISGNDLSVGNNTVSVVVKAENGETKTYKITVKRKQDPNYVLSSNANLGGISISAGAISPTFSADKTDYIVYLPYEYVGKVFSVTGNAADSKAAGVIDGTISSLEEGVNTTKVICKAEDGTEKTYKITVVVMPEYNGAVPNIEGVDAPVVPDTEIETEESEMDDTEENKTEKEETEDDSVDVSNKNKGKGSVIGTIIIVIIVIILMGALVYVLFLSKNEYINNILDMFRRD